MTRPFARLRRFRFNLPQRIAAVMLALFLAQGFWLVSRQTLSDRDYQYGPLRARDVGEAFTAGGLLHKLWQHP